MNSIGAKTLAKNLLDSEFDEANNNPVDYCESMGWEKDGASTKRAIKKAGVMSYDEDELLKLTLIIVDLAMDNDIFGIIEISENNKVSNFLVNCVAEHINR
jgi:hypothetical protein